MSCYDSFGLNSRKLIIFDDTVGKIITFCATVLRIIGKAIGEGSEMDRLKELKEQLDKNKSHLTNGILDEIVESIHQILENKLISIVLYGSYARGNNTDESDVDIALIVNGELSKDEDDALVHSVSVLCLKHDIVISANDIDVKKYEQWVSVLPYYKNIEKEGIVLWKAA